MRQTIRAALKRGRERVAVVCGAWHAPALAGTLPPMVRDAKILRGTPKRKVRLTWVPWTHERLASSTGYGAGVASPGWYHHLWTAPDQPIARWLTKVAHALRARDLMTSSAHVIEAVRLAETLASLRGRPLAGLAEVTEATRAVLCDGDELAVRYVTDHLVVGQALGSVSPDVPTVPLEADLLTTCRTLLIRRQAVPRIHDLDLRRSIDQARSRLFHRLRLLGLDWIQPAESAVQGQGTFRETWESCWEPEYAVAIVEAAVWGTTVESAATERVARIARAGQPARTDRVGRTLPARPAARGARSAAAGARRPGRAGCRRRAPDGRPATPGSGAPLRRCSRHRHHGAAPGRRGARRADLRRPAAGGRQPGRGRRGHHAPPDRPGERRAGTADRGRVDDRRRAGPR